MNLSKLQKYILRNSLASRKTNRQKFVKFYNSQKIKPKTGIIIKIITKSLERLIDKGLMVGYGEHTQFKWFIKEIELTAAGRRLAKKLLGEQQKLPLK